MCRLGNDAYDLLYRPRDDAIYSSKFKSVILSHTLNIKSDKEVAINIIIKTLFHINILLAV